MYTINSCLFNSRYIPNQDNIFTPNTTHLNIPKTSLKPFILSNSSDFSINFEDSLKTQFHGRPTSPYRLPIAIRNDESVSRYFWDGDEVKLVSIDGNSFAFSDFSNDFQYGLGKLVKICWSSGRNFFLPRVFTANYLEYVKWKLLHRVFSSALQVLATQAMFRAIGIGYSLSLPSAAALNWVMKDGLGRLSRCIYTASLASAFDTNLKRVRFTTSVMFSLSIGVELLTPAFPHYFLLLASIANIAKQISLACYLATGTAVHRSFAIADNVGEVSAKAQIQTVCFDNLGLVLAATLNILFKNNQRLLAGLPFVVYPIFSAADLFGIYQGLKHVHLQTVTKDRLEIIINMWIQHGYVPSPAEVSEIEGVDLFSSKGRKPWPIRVGCLEHGSQILKPSMLTLDSLNNDDFYFICMEILKNRLGTSGRNRILLCVREGASSLEFILGLLQACYFRKGLILNWPRWKDSLQACDSSNAAVLSEWFELMNASKQSAHADMIPLNEQMSALGWSFKNILLSAKEQVRYSFIPE